MGAAGTQNSYVEVPWRAVAVADLGFCTTPPKKLGRMLPTKYGAIFSY
jgi:hypothetical protein